MDSSFLECLVPIGAFCLVGFGFCAYLHYELKYNDRDLIYWKEHLQNRFTEIGRFKYAYTCILILAALNFLIIFLAFKLKSNLRNWAEEEDRENELKERYRDFIFIRLLNEIDKIEDKYLSAEVSSRVEALQNLVRAHDLIWSAILEFRKDAHKLFKLNETEIWMHSEDVFSLLENEEKEVIRTNYYRKVSIDDGTLASLLYE